MPDFPTVAMYLPTESIGTLQNPKRAIFYTYCRHDILTNSLPSDYKFLPHADSEKSLMKQGNQQLSAAELGAAESEGAAL